MSRAAAIARGLTVGYGFQAVVAAAGLALTPFLLARLGADDYGRWLVAGQVLAVLALLDLGVTAVLPREVARAAGRGEPVTGAVGRARWLVWLQTPAVAAVAGAAWWWAAGERPELAGPLAVVLAGFVVQFPLRLPAAVLAGRQDLAFAAAVQAGAWVVTTAVSVALVAAGFGLYALAVGWVAGQLAGCAAAGWRVRVKFPDARGGGGWPGRAALAAHLAPGLWTGVRQLAQTLVYATDLIVVGWVLGPAAVVVYACTTKLVSFVNNQPYLIASVAVPAMAELRAGGDAGRSWRATWALGVVILLVSGGVAVGVVGVNAAFVGLWVGPDRYAGPAVTLLAVAAMTARHWVFTWLQAAFAFGHDRRLGLAAVADGVVTVAATVGWTSLFGLAGVPLGSLTGLALTNGPVGLVTLAGAVGLPPGAVLRSALPWAVRTVVVVVPVAAVAFAPAAGAWWVGAAAAAGGVAAYLLLTAPLLGREPLAAYTSGPLAAARRVLRFRPRVAVAPGGR